MSTKNFFGISFDENGNSRANYKAKATLKIYENSGHPHYRKTNLLFKGVVSGYGNSMGRYVELMISEILECDVNINNTVKVGHRVNLYYSDVIECTEISSDEFKKALPSMFKDLKFY